VRVANLKILVIMTVSSPGLSQIKEFDSMAAAPDDNAHCAEGMTMRRLCQEGTSQLTGQRRPAQCAQAKV